MYYCRKKLACKQIPQNDDAQNQEAGRPNQTHAKVADPGRVESQPGQTGEVHIVALRISANTLFYAELQKCTIYYRVSQKKHSYKIFGLEIMLFTCSQTLWSGLRSSFTKWGTAPAFTTACKTTMSASRWRAWSLVQKFYKSVFSGTPCRK